MHNTWKHIAIAEEKSAAYTRSPERVSFFFSQVIKSYQNYA